MLVVICSFEVVMVVKNEKSDYFDYQNDYLKSKGR